jgi:hypothetical protein
MPPNQDEINLSGNYNSNRQTLLEDGRQIQDVHNSYSPIKVSVSVMLHRYDFSFDENIGVGYAPLM